MNCFLMVKITHKCEIIIFCRECKEVDIETRRACVFWLEVVINSTVRTTVCRTTVEMVMLPIVFILGGAHARFACQRRLGLRHRWD